MPYKIGSKITIGQYPQDRTEDSFAVQGIECTVVEVKADGTAIAIADKVLDCCLFDTETNAYNDSFLKKHTRLNFGENAFIPSRKQLRRWFPNAEDRLAEATDYAFEKGVRHDGGYAFYWTITPSSDWAGSVFVEESLTQFDYYCDADDSDLGVRPAFLLKE